jgi:hemolysin activation/secretion protein
MPKNTTFFYSLIALFFAHFIISQGAFAQSMGVVPGEISQLPPPPATQGAIPDIRIQRPEAGPDIGERGVSVRVDTLRIEGETRFSKARLIAATRFVPGRSLDFADLRRMANRIRRYYAERGYIVAQAYLPAQRIDNGVVTLVVVEGHYGSVRLQNRSRLRELVAQRILRGLYRGRPVTAASLERRLLLLSDIPGVRVSSTLSPGSAVGTSDLLVDVTNAPLITGDLEVDNYGYPYTGRYQGGGTVNFNNPLGIGDQASVRVLTSGSGMQYVRGAYQVPVGDATIGASYTEFHYQLDNQFSVLHADGSEQIASVYGSYPLIRSYDDNLWATAEFDHRTFQNNIRATSTSTDYADNVGIVGFHGDHHDTLGGGGWDSYSVYGSFGDLDVQSPLARAEDALTARSEGGYQKLTYSVSRLQTIAGPFSIYGWVRGQVASKDLDISEKMELGGPVGVRAYPEGEAYGDEGYIATFEGRLWLPTPPSPIPGRLQLVGFFDTGHVKYEQTPFIPGPNEATRSGAGAGLTWVDDGNFTAKISYAHIVGTGPATSSHDTSGELWFQVVKFF